MNVQIETSWKAVLQEEFDKVYFEQLVQFLKKEKQEEQIIYPEGSNIFNAFNQTPFDQLKVLLLGQDPYHGPGQAHGLCFSVQDGIKFPPSLQNIFKELQDDVQKPIPASGNLVHWAQQGVLMLNASLTVRANTPMSHSKIGWEIFTDRVIEIVSQKKEHVIFILWGRFAQEKERLIDTSKHEILKAAHPSPFSAHQGFFGCKHFSQTNYILKMLGKEEIVW
ncbi:MAG: uracil-DNA glycosylase [Chitinophagaceae bacterium]|nr:uracil-DNA glycosylase [Chitinophagaceae bacterium]